MLDGKTVAVIVPEACATAVQQDSNMRSPLLSESLAIDPEKQIHPSRSDALCGSRGREDLLSWVPFKPSSHWASASYERASALQPRIEH